MQPAVVIVKTIYTDEEAQRREEEEDLFRQKFEEIEGEVRLEFFPFSHLPSSQIRLWLSISEGHKALSQAVTLKRVSLFVQPLVSFFPPLAGNCCRRHGAPRRTQEIVSLISFFHHTS